MAVVSWLLSAGSPLALSPIVPRSLRWRDLLPGAVMVGVILVELEVLKKFRDQIRENSVVRLRTGAKLMGPTVVYITAGTSDARLVPANDTIPALSGGDIQTATASFGEVAREFPAVMANVKVLSSSLSSA